MRARLCTRGVARAPRKMRALHLTAVARARHAPLRPFSHHGRRRLPASERVGARRPGSATGGGRCERRASRAGRHSSRHPPPLAAHLRSPSFAWWVPRGWPAWPAAHCAACGARPITARPPPPASTPASQSHARTPPRGRGGRQARAAPPRAGAAVGRRAGRQGWERARRNSSAQTPSRRDHHPPPPHQPPCPPPGPPSRWPRSPPWPRRRPPAPRSTRPRARRPNWRRRPPSSSATRRRSSCARRCSTRRTPSGCRPCATNRTSAASTLSRSPGPRPTGCWPSRRKMATATTARWRCRSSFSPSARSTRPGNRSARSFSTPTPSSPAWRPSPKRRPAST